MPGERRAHRSPYGLSGRMGSPLADAILDRVVYNAYRIDLTGDSMRKRCA